MEHAILRDLERRVLIYASALRHAADVAAEIDWYKDLSMAEAHNNLVFHSVICKVESSL